jgi:hypothetical protein
MRRLALVLATLAIVAPAQAQAAFGPQARFDVVVPAGESQAVRDFAVDGNGFVYVLWPGLVQKYDPAGGLVKAWGGFGTAPGQFTPTDSYTSTSSIAVDLLGNLYVADTPGGRVVKFTTDGDFLANMDGFTAPSNVVVDELNNLIVTDRGGLRRYTPYGALIRQGGGSTYMLTPGRGDRLYYLAGSGRVERVGWFEGGALNPSPYGGPTFPLLFGDAPDERGNYSSSCCGMAFVQGGLWVARSTIHTLEAYGADGGFLGACPASETINELAAGRDGRLYVGTPTSVIRYGDAAQPCDTERPRVKGVQLSQRVLRISSYRRLRKAELDFQATEQGEATIRLTRLVKRRHGPARRVRVATYDDIQVSVTDGVAIRFVDRFWRKRPPLGRYEISIVVQDRAGLRSDPATVRIRITR